MHGPMPTLYLMLMPVELLFSAIATGIVSAMLAHRKVAGFRWGWLRAAVPVYAFALTEFVFYQMNGGVSGHYDLGAWAIWGFLPFLLFSFVAVGASGAATLQILDIVAPSAGRVQWAELFFLAAVATGAWIFVLGPQWRQYSNTGQLTVGTDETCFLVVNGVPKAGLTPRGSTTLRVGAGMLVLDCAMNGQIAVPPAARAIFRMPKRGSLSVVLHVTHGPLEALEETRFTVASEQEVRDALLDVVWTKWDSGQLITADGADRYCKSLGAGWRVPTSAELMSLVDPSKRLSISCGPRTCFVSPLFVLRQGVYWGTNEFDRAPDPYGTVVLVDGHRDNSPPNSASADVLCVRQAAATPEGSDP